MANQRQTSGSGDDVPTNAPVEHPGANPRQIIKQLTELNQKLDHLAKPPAFRVADGVQLLAILIGLAAALFTASGISARLDDLRARQSDAERRLDTRMGDVERRLDGRLDRIEGKLDEMSRSASK
jgi:hypothetical protein